MKRFYKIRDNNKTAGRKATILKRGRKMYMSLNDKGETVIRVSKGNYPAYRRLIERYISLYGGKKLKENRVNLYFLIYADLLNRKRGQTK